MKIFLILVYEFKFHALLYLYLTGFHTSFIAIDFGSIGV